MSVQLNDRDRHIDKRIDQKQFRDLKNWFNINIYLVRMKIEVLFELIL